MFSMKNVLITLAMVVAIQPRFYAQMIFPRVGLSISTSTFVPPGQPTEVQPRSSILFGLGVEFPVAKKLGVLLECDYVSRNFRLYSDGIKDDFGYHYETVIRHRYIDFPVTLKGYFGREKYKAYVTVGGYAGIGMGGSSKGKLGFYKPGDVGKSYDGFEGEIHYEPEPSWDTGQDLYYENRIDFGLVGGGGVIIYGLVALDIRYGFGLVDINENVGGYKNRTFQVTATVPLRIAFKEKFGINFGFAKE